MKWIDDQLNKITMYRLMLYYLIAIDGIAIVFGAIGVLHYRPIDILVSTLVLVCIAWAVNYAFAKLWGIPANAESSYITALILALIITPPTPSQYFSPSGIPFLAWAALFAMASKFILAIRKKHLFNPAAIALVITAYALNQYASWWVCTLVMMPFVALGGLLVARKISRFDLVCSFLITATLTILGFGIANGANPLLTTWRTLAEAPVVFFAFVMLTEPLTTPPTRTLRIWYGALIGFIFAPAIHVGPIASTPELALVVGNIFSYLASPKEKYILKFKEKISTGPDTYDFVFNPDQKLKFEPGQYLEWTLGHANSDSRGNRRYFTVASSPEENEARLGIKFYPESSSFKKALLSINPGATIVAGQRAGDFILPKDKHQKLVFIAGGIGITPFRSMIKHLLATHEERPIVLFYSNRIADEITYKEVFDEAQRNLKIKTVYTLTDKNSIPSHWTGYSGRLDAGMLAKEVPDYKERTFYLSGPRSMVVGFEEVLRGLGIAKKHIKTDFFPGFA